MAEDAAVLASAWFNWLLIVSPRLLLFCPHPHTGETIYDLAFCISYGENIEKQKDKLIFSDFFAPESQCPDRVCVILIGIKTKGRIKWAEMITSDTSSRRCRGQRLSS